MTQNPSDIEMSQIQNPGQQKGWFGRNWKWFVPTLILVPLFCCCGVPTAVMFFYKDHLVSMVDAYMEPIALAEQSAAAGELLGTPLVTGEPTQDPADTGASTITMLYPVSGPKASGEIRAQFEITNPLEPELISAELTVTGTGETIDLLNGDSADNSTDELIEDAGP